MLIIGLPVDNVLKSQQMNSRGDGIDDFHSRECQERNQTSKMNTKAGAKTMIVADFFTDHRNTSGGDERGKIVDLVDSEHHIHPKPRDGGMGFFLNSVTSSIRSKFGLSANCSREPSPQPPAAGATRGRVSIGPSMTTLVGGKVVSVGGQSVSPGTQLSLENILKSIPMSIIRGTSRQDMDSQCSPRGVSSVQTPPDANIAPCSAFNDSFEFLAGRPPDEMRQSISVLHIMPTSCSFEEECHLHVAAFDDDISKNVDHAYEKRTSRRQSTLPANSFRCNSLVLDKLFLSTKAINVENIDELVDEGDGDDVLADDLHDIQNEVPHRKSSISVSSLFPSMNAGSSVATAVDMTASTKEFVEGLCVIAPSHRSSFMNQYHVPSKRSKDGVLDRNGNCTAGKSAGQLFELWHRECE